MITARLTPANAVHFGESPGGGAPLDGARARRWGAWIDRIADGDLDACAALYDESAPLAFGILMRMLRDRETAEAALVDLYVDVRCRAARGEQRGHHAVAWLVSVTYAIATARLSRRAARRRVVLFRRAG